MNDLRILYNEHDPFAAAWLDQLIAAGAIPAGDVDRRDIRDIAPADLDGYDQCHFFAGISGWSEALRHAGLSGMRGLWTGSCPCQSFSSAGRRLGFADERHLWPSWFHLIRECRPAIVFGEQVEAAVRHGWLDLVQADLEGEGYACGAAVLGAHSVGAPHIRQRLWFAAHADDARSQGRRVGGHCAGEWPAGQDGVAGLMGDAGGEGSWRNTRAVSSAQGEGEGRWSRVGCQPHEPFYAGAIGELGDAWREGRRQVDENGGGRCGGGGAQGLAERPIHERARGDGGMGDAASQRCGETRPALIRSDAPEVSACSGHWDAIEWLPCRDGKARPTLAGLQPLASRVPNRVGTLRGAGNAIVPQVAAAFITAAMESRP